MISCTVQLKNITKTNGLKYYSTQYMDQQSNFLSDTVGWISSRAFLSIRCTCFLDIAKREHVCMFCNIIDKITKINIEYD
jgi:hypothetical protein